MAFEKHQIEMFTSAEGNIVELNVKCAACDGTGVEVDLLNRTFNDCAACGKTGSRLTWAGLDLMQFIRTHTDHPDRDAAYEDLQEN